MTLTLSLIAAVILSTWVGHWLEERAKRRAERAPIRLSRHEAERFVQALSEPAEPTPALRQAAADYHEAIRSGRLVSRD